MFNSLTRAFLTLLAFTVGISELKGQQNSSKQQPDLVRGASSDSSELSQRMERFLGKKNINGRATGLKIVTAENTFEIDGMNGWTFRRVRYVPAVVPGRAASFPLLDAVVALRGTNEEFVLQATGDHSDFGEFLRYNNFIIRTAGDANMTMNVFRRAFKKTEPQESAIPKGHNKFEIPMKRDSHGRQEIMSIETEADGLVRTFKQIRE